MPKKYVPIRLDKDALNIVDHVQKERHLESRTKAIETIIKEYPLLKARAESKLLEERLLKTMEKQEKRPIMPDLCKHINCFNMKRNRVFCSDKQEWVTVEDCRSCERREPINASK